MIAVRDAIDRDLTIACSVDQTGPLFAMKVLSFRKIDPSNIDDIEEVSTPGVGTLWLMELRLLNATKEPLFSCDATRCLRLVDGDGCQFPMFEDDHLQCNSDYSESSGLRRFFATELLPKIALDGAVAFFLPDESGAEYALLANDGILEVLKD